MVWNQFALADLVVSKTIDEDYRGADAVVAVTIARADPSFVGKVRCGTRYHGVVIKAFKGIRDMPRHEVTFGREIQLSVGHEYILFLRTAHSLREEYEKIVREVPEIQWSGSIESRIALVGCNGLIPGYLFDSRAIWELKHGGVYLAAFWPPSAVPSAIRVDYHNGGVDWILNQTDVFHYLSSLPAKERNHR